MGSNKKPFRFNPFGRNWPYRWRGESYRHTGRRWKRRKRYYR